MIFQIFNLLIWALVVGLMVSAHYFKHPLSPRRQITTGHMIRSMGAGIAILWMFLVGIFHSCQAMIDLVKGAF